jgi:hypothetical protein
VCAAGLLAFALIALSPTGSGSAASGLVLKVQGNRLVDGDGRTVRLLGVNRSSFEYACAQGWGMSEGRLDRASIAAMKKWRINTVRVPLNEACWLGLANVEPQYRGSAYRREVVAYVSRLHAAGLYVILDLHWNAPGDARALGQWSHADADHSADFWRSVATTFRSDRAILFDLYNEPHDVSWQCWRDGCDVPDEKTPGRAAGMQQLVNAIRSTGSKHPLLLGGLNWANDLSGWLRWRPSDPARQLVASVHVYPLNACDEKACWDAAIAPVAKRVPVVSGEIGQVDCKHGFIERYMSWADRHGVSYLAWGWNDWGCDKPGLIKDYNGTPTETYGQGFRAHLARLK